MLGGNIIQPHICTRPQGVVKRLLRCTGAALVLSNMYRSAAYFKCAIVKRSREVRRPIMRENPRLYMKLVELQPFTPKAVRVKAFVIRVSVVPVEDLIERNDGAVFAAGQMVSKVYSIGKLSNSRENRAARVHFRHTRVDDNAINVGCHLTT